VGAVKGGVGEAWASGGRSSGTRPGRGGGRPGVRWCGAALACAGVSGRCLAWLPKNVAH